MTIVSNIYRFIFFLNLNIQENYGPKKGNFGTKSFFRKLRR